MYPDKVIEAIVSHLRVKKNLKAWCRDVGEENRYTHFKQIANGDRRVSSLTTASRLCKLLGIDANTGKIVSEEKDQPLLFSEHPATVPRPSHRNVSS